MKTEEEIRAWIKDLKNSHPNWRDITPTGAQVYTLEWVLNTCSICEDKEDKGCLICVPEIEGEE